MEPPSRHDRYRPVGPVVPAIAPERDRTRLFVGLGAALLLLAPCLWFSRGAIELQRLRWLQEDWRPTVQRLAALPPGEALAEGHLPGRVLPIRIDLHYLEHIEQYEPQPPVLEPYVFEALPGDLRPTSADDVAAVLLLRYKQYAVGVYVTEAGDKVAGAWQQECELTLLDAQDGTVLHEELLFGDTPPEVQHGNAINKFLAVRPDQIVAALTALPREP